MATVLEIERALELDVLGPHDAGRLMTLDEFEAAEFEDGNRYELINGVLIVTPAPLEEERSSNDELGRWLRNYRESHAEGSALDDTLPEQNIRTKRQNRRCDRAIWAGLGRQPRTRGPVAQRDVPTIVVEFPSRGLADLQRDYDEKKIEYRDMGATEYWIIDRFDRVLTVYAWRGKQWAKRTYAEDAVYSTPLLPGFELPLAKLLAVSDKYS